MSGGIGNPGYRYIILRMTLLLVFAVILFLAAGTLHWLRGWIWIVYTLFLETGTLIILVKRAPETLQQRGKLHVGVKTFDKAFAVCWLSLAFITPVVAGLDKRFGWSHLPRLRSIAGSFWWLWFGHWPHGLWSRMNTSSNSYAFKRIVSTVS